MFSGSKNGLLVGLMMAGIFLMPVGSWAESSGGHFAASGYHPTNDGGNFGLGIELGDPGNWGISGKIWIDKENAFQPAVKFGSSNAILQLDYLWHNFDLFHMNETSGELPFYIGVGGDLALQNTVAIAARLPIGMSYIFDKRNFPVDLYFQVVPTLWFFSGSTSFNFYPEIGAHVYL